MRHAAATLAAALAALALAGTARADIVFGVADDGGKYAHDGGANFFLALNDLGLTHNRATLLWDPTDGAGGLADDELKFLDRALPVADLRGVQVVLSVYPRRARTFAVDTRKRVDLFARFLGHVARRYPQVRQIIVGNEPNQPRFHQPQFAAIRGGGHRPVAAELWARIMAAAYDAIKAADPGISVVGLGLSPRGNDLPRAKSNVSRSPVRFLRDLAAAYRRSGRTRPIMDELAFHPYPNSNDDPLTRGYAWPNAGIQDLGRIRQAIWDGFHGTAQPVFAEPGVRGRAGSLKLLLDEYGRQVEVIESSASVYHGDENVPTIDEAAQASIYSTLIRRLACEPDVSGFFLFHLIDEEDLDRFQSGLLRADWTKRPAYDAVKATLAATGGTCAGSMRQWRHGNALLRPRVTFSRGAGRVSAGEDAEVVAAVFPAAWAPAAVAAALRAGKGTTTTAITPRRGARLDRPTSLEPGRYRWGVLVRAAANPERQLLRLGPVFAVRNAR